MLIQSQAMTSLKVKLIKQTLISREAEESKYMQENINKKLFQREFSLPLKYQRHRKT